MRPGTGSGPSVLIVVQNLPVPTDRRVWLECLALRDAGYTVSVICPRGPGERSREMIDGIALYKYRPPPVARGALGYLIEFVYAWVRTAVLSLRVRRERGFSVIQACNPPDTYWALALLWRRAGVRFVYDQHDLNPELYLSRFGEPRTLPMRAQYGLLLKLERATYRAADHVISTNESYRSVALRRGQLAEDEVTVVRSGPDTRTMRPVIVEDDLRRGRRYLLVYLGVMGPQDGVDLVLRALKVIIDRGRDDVHVALLGFGDCLEELKELARKLGLDDHVTFTGRADNRMIAHYLSSADVGLCPDPKTPLNDVSTMNKTMEYMAYALPVVSFDLVETRVSAGDAGVYVRPGDIEAFAAAVMALLDDESRRVALALRARERVVAALDWRPQSVAYVGVFDQVTSTTRGQRQGAMGETASRRVTDIKPTDAWGNRLVELDADSLAQFVRGRGMVTRKALTDP